VTSELDAAASAALTVVEGNAELPAVAVDASAGRRIDRYVVVETIGQGGMGRVLRAYDPKLRREVAVKLLHRTTDATARARIAREAQAMARLSHPNIVAVFDVEVFEGQPFIVMEYVEGQTLAHWLAEPRGADEILAAFVDVAQGLSAAHEAGIVHRDVKPLNLLRDAAGRVRVTDFGIARSADEAMNTTSEPSARGHDDVGLTQLGTVIGTPPYMAPEQHEGRAADARSDQYAFCVALWEALTGARPFEGGDLAELVEAKRSMRLTSATDSQLSPPLRAALRRGLDPDPTRRHASMPALLAALLRARDHGRRRRWYAATGIAIAVAGGAWGLVHWDRARDRAACEDEGAAIAEVWNDDTRANLHATLVASGLEYAEATAQRVTPWFDDHAQQWRSAATDACVAATIDGTWDLDVYQAARWCLDDRREELAAVLARLLRGGNSAVEVAVRAASALTRVEPCSDGDALRRLPTPPVDRREEVAQARRELAGVRALIVAGSYVDAAEAGRVASEHAVALGWPPLVAVARMRFGVALAKTARHEEAERELEEAYFTAVAADAKEAAFDAATELTCLVGEHLVGRVDQGYRWSRQAEALLTTVPDPGGLRRATLYGCRATVEVMAGQYEAAVRLQQQALELVERFHGPDHPLVAVHLGGIAGVHYRLGAFDRATAMYQRALAIRVTSLGEHHPLTASSASNLGNMHFAAGDYEAARVEYLAAYEIHRRARGEQSMPVANALTNLGNVEWLTGAYEGAKVYYSRALAIFEAIHGPDHSAVAAALHNLAAVEAESGDFDTARALGTRALAILEASYGPDHLELAPTLANLADAQRVTGSPDLARAGYARAIAIWEAHGEHPDLAHALVGASVLALDEGDRVQAVRHAERALTIRERSAAPAPDLAVARYVLARALWADDRHRARALAEQAQQFVEQAKARPPILLSDLGAWLSAHAISPTSDGARPQPSVRGFAG
jgi:tetratricopeptide (TPR) repeat protein/predicted Ser/Thr protein kinase